MDKTLNEEHKKLTKTITEIQELIDYQNDVPEQDQILDEVEGCESDISKETPKPNSQAQDNKDTLDNTLTNNYITSQENTPQ